MTHPVIPQRWRTFPTPKRLSSPYFHGRAQSVCSIPPACRRGRTGWPARFGMMGVLLLCMACTGALFQPPPAPASPEPESRAPDMCLRAVSSLPKPSIVAGYVGNMVTFTASVVGNGSDAVEVVQIDYARRFQRTQSAVANVVDGDATTTVSVVAGHSYNYTARSHGPPVGAGYYCSRFAEVLNINVPDPARN